MCSLRFENNFLTDGRVCFRFENSCLAIERVRFASKKFLFYLMCSLRFESNFLSIYCVRFASKIIFFVCNVFASPLRK
jgi:hypothetical protein